MIRDFRFAIALVFIALSMGVNGAAKSSETKVPPQVRALEGIYTGSWTMYGISASGKIERKMSWTDIVTASGAKVAGNRAFVTTNTVMNFADKNIQPFKMQGREGYILNPDGSFESYFIEVFGQTHRMVSVAKNVWSYSAQAGANELTRLGFPGTASGQHVLVKVVSMEKGKELHRISRITIVKWKTGNGKEKTLSYVSLKGHHTRRK